MPRIKLKGAPKRKYQALAVLIIFFLLLIFGGVFTNYIAGNKVVISATFMKLLMSDTVHITTKENVLPQDLVSKFINFNIKEPATILSSSLNNIVDLNQEYITTENHDDELKRLESISSYVYDPNPVEITNPIIYLYNTHQLENYSSEQLESYDIKPTVMMSAFLLREKLNAKNTPTIVETMNVTEFLKISGWSYDDAYKASRIFALDAKNKYPTLKYFLDIHRDSIDKASSTIDINGKKYARILFVVGTNNPEYTKNKDLATKVSDMLNKAYPGLSKGIMEKGGASIRGIYNQDLSPNSMLLEVGAVENNLDEVIATIEVLSDIISVGIMEGTL